MNKFDRKRRLAASVKQMYPPGTRIELICMNDPYSPVERGMRGTVQSVDDIGQLLMKWVRFFLIGTTVVLLVLFPVKMYSENFRRKKLKLKTNLHQQLKKKRLMKIMK